MGNDLISSLSFAAAGMETQAMRLRHVSENIANADTPGYHRKLVSFQEEMQTGQVKTGPVKLDRSELLRIYDPGHPLADENGDVWTAPVDENAEMVEMLDSSRQYQNLVEALSTAKQLMLETMRIK